MTARTVAAAGCLAILIAGCASAREVWVVQFNVAFQPDFPPCANLVAWHSQLLFRNATDQQLPVTFLGVSNGPARSDAQALSTNPHRTVSLEALEAPGLHWEPDVPPAGALIWVNKLDVPDGVVVSGRAVAEVNEIANPGSPGPCVASGHYFSNGLSLRVFDHLTPASVPQYHLGIDIGSHLSVATPSSADHRSLGAAGGRVAQTTPSIDSRINVGVFNASAVRATADVKILCSPEVISDEGDDAQLVSMQISVPANSLVQQTVLQSTAAVPCPFSDAAPYHVAVTSDQPGFSYAAALSNELLPKFPGFSPVTF
jgi:hypothetical protein